MKIGQIIKLVLTIPKTDSNGQSNENRVNNKRLQSSDRWERNPIQKDEAQGQRKGHYSRLSAKSNREFFVFFLFILCFVIILSSIYGCVYVYKEIYTR